MKYTLPDLLDLSRIPAEPAERFRIWFTSLPADVRLLTAAVLWPLAEAVKNTMIDIETSTGPDWPEIAGPGSPDLSCVSWLEIEEEVHDLKLPCSGPALNDVAHIIDYLCMAADLTPSERYAAIGAAHHFVTHIEMTVRHEFAKRGLDVRIQ